MKKSVRTLLAVGAVLLIPLGAVTPATAMSSFSGGGGSKDYSVPVQPKDKTPRPGISPRPQPQPSPTHDPKPDPKPDLKPDPKPDPSHNPSEPPKPNTPANPGQDNKKDPDPQGDKAPRPGGTSDVDAVESGPEAAISVPHAPIIPRVWYPGPLPNEKTKKFYAVAAWHQDGRVKGLRADYTTIDKVDDMVKKMNLKNSDSHMTFTEKCGALVESEQGNFAAWSGNSREDSIAAAKKVLLQSEKKDTGIKPRWSWCQGDSDITVHHAKRIYKRPLDVLPLPPTDEPLENGKWVTQRYTDKKRCESAMKKETATHSDCFAITSGWAAYVFYDPAPRADFVNMEVQNPDFDASPADNSITTAPELLATLQFSDKIRPGARLVSPDSQRGCSIGFIAADPKTKQYYAITAGHCGPANSEQTWYLAKEDNTLGAPVGSITVSKEDATGDYALIAITPESLPLVDPSIPGTTQKIKGVGPQGWVNSQPHDLTICRIGATTGGSCGPALPEENSWILFRGVSDHGDSGGAVYGVTKSGEIVALGILRGATRMNTTATIRATSLNMILNAHGLSLVV